MKHKFLCLALAAGMIACGIAGSQAVAAENGAKPARARVLERVAEKLQLTPEQRTQIKAVLAGEKGTLAPLLSATHAARKDLRAAIRAKDASEVSVRAAADKAARAEADLAVERMKLYGKIAPILTDSQRQQLADLQERADGLIDKAIGRLGAGLDE